VTGQTPVKLSNTERNYSQHGKKGSHLNYSLFAASFLFKSAVFNISRLEMDFLELSAVFFLFHYTLAQFAKRLVLSLFF
jgi:hypothetical protein